MISQSSNKVTRLTLQISNINFIDTVGSTIIIFNLLLFFRIGFGYSYIYNVSE